MQRSSKLGIVFGGTALVGIGFLLGTVVSPTRAGGGEPEMDPEMVMAKWMEYATPGPEHEKLMEVVGTWNVATKFWEYPGSEPQMGKATAVVKPVLGDRFVVEEFSSMMPMGDEVVPFEGRNLFGYDNLQDKYVYAWADTFMTGIMTGSGTYNAAGDVLTMYSKNSPNPMTGEFDEVKSVVREINADRHVFEMYRRNPDGSWFKMMEATYTRAM